MSDTITEYYKTHPMKPYTTTAHDVVQSFAKFLQVYKSFRIDNGLDKGVGNIFEICTSMTDKHGRICRQIKHFERNDKKTDWPDAISEALTGYIVYAIMILEKYGIDVLDGMRKELGAAKKQWAKKG